MIDKKMFIISYLTCDHAVRFRARHNSFVVYRHWAYLHGGFMNDLGLDKICYLLACMHLLYNSKCL